LGPRNSCCWPLTKFLFTTRRCPRFSQTSTHAGAWASWRDNGVGSNRSAELAKSMTYEVAPTRVMAPKKPLAQHSVGLFCCLAGTCSCVHFGRETLCPVRNTSGFDNTQYYEAALRHWGEVLLSQDTELVGWQGRHRAQLMQNALDERDAANQRICLHKRNCPACKLAQR
jgi:hypothetical protein